MFTHVSVYVEDDSFEVGVTVEFYENHGFEFVVEEFSKNEGTWESGDDASDDLRNNVHTDLSDNEYEYRVSACDDAAERARDAHYGL